MEKSDKFDLEFLKTHEIRIPRLFEKLLDRSIFRNSPGAKAELSAYLASKNSDFIYSVCGPLGTTKLFPNKVLAWTFKIPSPSLKKSIQLSYRENILNKSAGFFCLTPSAESYFSQFAPSIFIPWCVDMDLFDPKKEIDNEYSKPFFLATGKTERDYETLIKSAYNVAAEIRIIAPNCQKPSQLPANINWVDSSVDPPDQAIDYPTLRKWYSQCKAVCIPLTGNPKDTSGYTNMLEAMAMSKPVLMTDSGCLHTDPENGGFGELIQPQDYHGWSISMNRILNNIEESKLCGQRGRKLAEINFTLNKFKNNFLSAFNHIIADNYTK